MEDRGRLYGRGERSTTSDGPDLARRRLLRYAAGLSAAMVAGRALPVRAEPIEYAWVVTSRATPLRLDEAGTEVRWLPRGILLRVSPSASGSPLHAWCPAFATFGKVDAAAVEDAPAPTETELAEQRRMPVLPVASFSGEMPARVVGSANVRFWPEVRPDTMVRTLNHNAELVVAEVVDGEDGETWYRLSDSVAPANSPGGASYFVHHGHVRLPRQDFHPTPRNPDRMPAKWFEADLMQPALLTAYEDGRAVWSSLALHGVKPDVTPTGEHRITWRVARETMTSERVYPPIPRNAPGGYYLENVLYTQYFHWNGAAIHYNYWSANWGYAGSHGCLGLPLAESKWCWDWAERGVPVLVFS